MSESDSRPLNVTVPTAQPACPPCPFAVGDRIRETVVVKWDDEADTKTERIEHPYRPDATVTEVRDDGFCYEYEVPVPIGRAAWGQMMTGGTCYPSGYHMWRKVS